MLGAIFPVQQIHLLIQKNLQWLGGKLKDSDKGSKSFCLNGDGPGQEAKS